MNSLDPRIALVEINQRLRVAEDRRRVRRARASTFGNRTGPVGRANS